MINLEADGKRFEGFKNIRIETTLDTISGQFSFEATGKENFFVPVKVGQTAKIFVEDEQVIEGFIEKISVNYDKESHALTIEGRDKTADVIDSTTGDDIKFEGKNGGVDFQGSISLKSIIQQTLEAQGIPDIDVINQVDNLENFAIQDVHSSEVGESVFEFLKRTARKRHVFLTTDGQGNIVISRSKGVDVPEKIINRPGDLSSNVLSASVNYDNTNRFFSYIVKSQLNTSGGLGFGGFTSSSEITNQQGKSEDSFQGNPNIRTSRRLTIQADSCNSGFCQERAQWERQIRITQGSAYSAVVQGHRRAPNQGIWKPGQLVRVTDVFADIVPDDTMLINNCVYEVSEDGSKTTLTFVDKNAYDVRFEEPIADKKSTDRGINALFGGG